MSNVRVRISFRNDLFQRLVDENPLPTYRIAEEAGVPYHWLVSVKSMRRSPFKWNRETYSDNSEKMSAYFRVPPEVLFPPELYRIKWPSKVEKAYPVERIACFLESDESRMRALPPHEQLEEKEKKLLVRKMLDKLPPRERKVIEMRFGIGDEEKTSLENVSIHHEVTRERIRQIEAKALSRMRRPSRTKEIREYRNK